jgi:hypothetical protein
MASLLVVSQVLHFGLSGKKIKQTIINYPAIDGERSKLQDPKK